MFGMRYGANTPFMAPLSGEPGKAPASNAIQASPATSVPSFFAPTLMRM